MERVSNVQILQKFKTMEEIVQLILVLVVKAFLRMVLVFNVMINTILLMAITARNVHLITFVNQMVFANLSAMSMKEGCSMDNAEISAVN